ncbi:DUF3784 domain-containing protein [Virgibacillus sp. CBA3643]|uniref:DUF3784 domain-containing protein n=1 Tax=Virgibacillus sp. CBA3643 TaxID=2942278 RepID=UPI0035A398C9
MDTIIGIIIGALLIWCGYLVWYKKTFFFLAGFQDFSEPVNKVKLARRAGILLILIGIIAVITSILVNWFNSVVGVTGILVLIAVILIIVSIAADQMGY